MYSKTTVYLHLFDSLYGPRINLYFPRLTWHIIWSEGPPVPLLTRRGCHGWRLICLLAKTENRVYMNVYIYPSLPPNYIIAMRPRVNNRPGIYI